MTIVNRHPPQPPMTDYLPNHQLSLDRPSTRVGHIFNTPTEHPAPQTTLITRIRSQTRRKSITRGVNSTSQDITIEETENTPRLDHDTLFNTLKDLLNNIIKLAIETQLGTLQNIFTERMKGILE